MAAAAARVEPAARLASRAPLAARSRRMAAAAARVEPAARVAPRAPLAPRWSATPAWRERHGVAVGAALGTLVLVFVLAPSVTVRRDPPAYAGVGSAVVALSLDPAQAHHATIPHRGSA